jgi:acyl carrier protein
MEAVAMEALLQRIWQEVLGRPEVDIDLLFPDLGGTSLDVVEAVDRVERELGIPVPLTILFEAPTIRLLAGRLLAGGDLGQQGL